MSKDGAIVSVVITTYNREKSLGRAIESVLVQSYSNIEIIIIDNGSTDGTRDVVRSYEKEHKINYIYKDNKDSYIPNLNSGIVESRGKYIAMLDDDDYWCDKEKLEKQVNFLEKNIEYVLVGGGAIKIDKDGKEIVRYLVPEKDADVRKKILISNTIVHATVLFKKDAWKKSGGYGEDLDWGLWLRMGKIGKFYNIQEFFIVYAGHMRGDPGYIEKKYGRKKWLKLNIKLKKKYKDNYSGYRKAIFLCWVRYFYSFLPFRHELWPLLFKTRKLFSRWSLCK